jgi:SAM-dependent methyltransferase
MYGKGAEHNNPRVNTTLESKSSLRAAGHTHTVELISPHNGSLLTQHAPNLLSDGELLWPVVDSIAYLRSKHSVREAAVALLQQHQTQEALVILLQDQDPFAPLPPPDADTLRELLNDPTITLRAALQMLNYGPVADYFAYRWATPTFLSGLALLQLTAQAQRPVVEIACGMGHFLRMLEANGVATVGVDLVFSKLWLARRYLGIQGTLVCGDTNALPLRSQQPSTVFCHDAFYFFEDKKLVLAALRTLAAGGSLALGHVHTDAIDHRVAGTLRSAEAYRRMADAGASFYDDKALTAAWLAQQAPSAQPISHLTSAEAVAWIEGEPRSSLFPLDRPASPLSRNPLLGSDGSIQWPTERFRDEYEGDSGYLREADPLPDDGKTLDATERARLFRNRVLLDLPSAW